MKSLYKFKLEDKESNIIELPLDSYLLNVEFEENAVTITSLIETEQKETISYDFRTYNTNSITPKLDGYKSLGSFSINSKEFSRIVFYKIISD